MRTIGTVVRGVRAPIIREGDNIAEVAAASVMEAWKEAGIEPRDRDVVAVTESVVARAQGNYATLDQIAKDVREKTGGGTVGVAFPILSRNRFSLLLRGMAMGCKKIVLLLSYPSDEVGNGLVDWDKLDEAGVDPYSDVLTLEQFREKFGAAVHPFTGVDYIDFYSGIITDAGAEVEVIFGNRVQTLCDYTDAVITCDIHTRARSKRLLKAAGARVVLGLDDLLNRSVDGSGYNAEYGLLGSNKATEETVKLFPRDCMAVAEELGERLSKASGKHIEAMVYGDGAFKDPVGKIWELADPVVSPGYTKGLVGTPNELKLKYLADNDFGDLKGEALKEAIEERIREKTSESLVGNMVSEGTTPRHLTDLIGSLCDLTSGSGDTKVYGCHYHTWRSAASLFSILDGKNTIIDGKYDFMKPTYDMVIAQQKDGICMDYGYLKTSSLHYSAAFENQQCAMVNMGSWFISTLEAYMKDAETKFNWGIVKYPHPAGAEAGSTLGTVTSLAINADSPKAEAAADFINWCVSEEGAQAIAKTGTFPACGSAATAEIIKSTEGFPEDSNSVDALTTSNVYLEMPYTQYASDIETILNAEHDAIMTMSETVDEGIQNMNDQVPAVLG